MCVSKLTIVGSDNDLSPGRHQAIMWNNTGILLFLTLRTNFSEILTKIRTYSFKKMRLKCCLRNGGNFVSISMVKKRKATIFFTLANDNHVS